MINLHFYGHIGEKFPGDQKDGSWLLDVQSPREAMMAVEANRPGLRQYLVDSANYGVEYRVVIDNKEIETVEQIYYNCGIKEHGTIDIIPEVIGASSSGIWSIVAGVVLIIVGVVLAVYGGGFLAAAGVTAVTSSGVAVSGIIAGALASALIGAGVGLAIGGVEALLFPPKGASTSNNKPSDLFGGQVNTTGQGGCIPLCYGDFLIGSQLVSAYLTSIEIDPKSGDPINDNDPTNPVYAVNSVWAELNGRLLADTPYTPDYDGTDTTSGMAGGGGGGDVLGGTGQLLAQ